MKNSIKPILTGLILSFTVSSCNKDKIEPSAPVVKDNVSFATDIQPILTSKCATCHNPTEVNPDFREGEAYVSIEELIEEGEVIPGDAEGSELVEMLEGNSADGNTMPPSGSMANSNIALIKKWIDEGAKQN